MKIFKKWLKEKLKIKHDPPEYVCGMCGASKENNSSYCVNGHDHWVCIEDLYNWGLNSYIDECNLTREALQKLLGD